MGFLDKFGFYGGSNQDEVEGYNGEATSGSDYSASGGRRRRG